MTRGRGKAALAAPTAPPNPLIETLIEAAAAAAAAIPAACTGVPLNTPPPPDLALSALCNVLVQARVAVKGRGVNKSCRLCTCARKSDARAVQQLSAWRQEAHLLFAAGVRTMALCLGLCSQLLHLVAPSQPAPGCQPGWRAVSWLRNAARGTRQLQRGRPPGKKNAPNPENISLLEKR